MTRWVPLEVLGSPLKCQVEALDARVTELFGFPYAYPVTGQTYSRKIDADVLGPLSSFGATVHKIATDSRFTGITIDHQSVCLPISRRSRNHSRRTRSEVLPWPTR
jgi:hypothetical protein